ncbi:hypothetical protein JI666_03850 [Bacillus sp. NTK071]|uniref:DUF6414 family protein n=1 Tax=Bacillus sp. NTK071 TaxID=2802175 RepID=UPI001A8CC695|nr:hypothetical protein [Bacillus sp. NTK071]MBN8207878.1 hypothetical protein [Bacillus sp. NTK071]
MIDSLKDFYYLDEKILRNYVSTIEDGLIKYTESSTSDGSPKWNFDISTGELQKILVSMGIPIPATSIKREGKGKSVNISQLREPTKESLFSKLDNYLEPAIQYLEGFDREIWAQLEEGQFVRFSTKVKLSKGYEIGNFLNNAGDFFNLANNLDIDMEVDEDFNSAVNYGKKAIEKDVQKAIFRPIGSPNSAKFFFVGSLGINSLEVDISDLSLGTYTVMGRIEHVLQAGEKYTIFDPTLSGMTNMLSREHRRAKTKIKSKNEFDFDSKDIFAVKPAIVIKPIALYK